MCSQNFEQILLAEILNECDGAIKQNAIAIEQRAKAKQAATETAKARAVQVALLKQQAMETLMTKLAADSPELRKSETDLKLFKSGLSWFEGKERSGGYHGSYTFKSGALALLLSHTILLPLKQMQAPVAIPARKIAELIANYKKSVVKSNEHAAAQVKKGWQQRIPLLMNDLEVKRALVGGDPFHLLRSALTN